MQIGTSGVETVSAPPKTRNDDVKETIHGVGVADPYRWLEDQESAETRAWIEAQNRYTESILSKLSWRETLRTRVAELLKIDAVGVPTVCNGRYFFLRRSADQDLAVIYLRKGLHGADEVLIDPNTMSADKMTSVGLLDVSDDGTMIAYAVRQGGEDEITVHLFDVDARKNLPDTLPKGRLWGISIKPDKSGFYYTRYADDGPRVYYHVMGADSAQDQKIFGDGYGPDKIINADLSEDGRYLLVTVYYGSAGQKTEVHCQDIDRGGPCTPIVKDIDARFQGQIAADHLYMLTNWQAPKGRILDVDLNHPAQEHWQEIIPTGDAVIEGFSLVGGKLFLNYLKNVHSEVKVYRPDGAFERDIALPSIGTIGVVVGRWTDPEAFFSFSSFHIPSAIYRYNVEDGSREEWVRIDVPIDSNEIQVDQVWYESKDGTKIPMFLVYKRGLKPDGACPTLLTGYGGFNVSLTPGFSLTAALWAELGGVYAVANLRGGGEFGEVWHRDGMLEKKQNVFDDFIAAAEWLINSGYTQPSKLAIMGGSNGGLLVGATMTQRPDLCGAVICAVPLLDMVRYHKFLVAGFWVPEYGSSDDAEQFRTIYAYSPYHHVEPGANYPAIMFVTGDADTRVAPLHARKMAALLQTETGSGKPVLLHYDTKAGHSAGLPISKQIEDSTDVLSFLCWQLGVKVDANSTGK